MGSAAVVFDRFVQSDATKKQYAASLKAFCRYAKVAEDNLLTMPEKQIQTLIEDYIFSLKGRGLSRSSANGSACAIQLYLSMNDVNLNWTKIKKLVSTIPLKKANDKAYTAADIQKILQGATSLRDRAIIHFIAASGVRVGAIPGMRLKHLAELPGGCKSVLVYAGEAEQYMTFLTPEASKILNDYFQKRINDGERMTPDAPVFRQSYGKTSGHVKPVSLDAIKDSMRWALRDSGFKARNGRYDNMRFHGFRKRFATVLKNHPDINPSAAERLLGHKAGLDSSYYKPTDQELFNEYLKAVVDLTVSDTERVVAELQAKEIEVTELKAKEQEIHKLRLEFEEYKNNAQSELYFERVVQKILGHYIKTGEKLEIKTEGSKWHVAHPDKAHGGWDCSELGKSP